MTEPNLNLTNSRSGRKLAGVIALSLTVSVVVVLAMTRRAWLAPSATVIGGASDGVQKAWFLSWVAFAVDHGHDPLLTTYLSIAGHPIDLMRNNAVPLLGLLLLPVTLAAGAILSLNLATILTLVAGPVVTAAVFHRYVHNWPAASVGGLAFGLSPFVFAEADLGHLPWISLWFLPLTLLLADEILVRQRHRPWALGVALGALLSCELLVNQELLATTCVVTALVLALVAIYYRRAILPHVHFAARSLMGCLIVFVVLCAYPLLIEFTGPGHVVHGANMSPLLFSADLLGFVLPNSHQLLSPSWATSVSTHFTGDTTDTTVYFGLPLLAAVALGWLRYRTIPWVRWASVLTVVAMVLSLGSRLHIGGRILDIPLPWALLGRLPLIGLVMPSRIVVFALLGACLCLALVVDQLWASPSTAAHVIAAVLIGTAGLFFAPEAALYVQPLSVPSFFVTKADATVPRGSYVAVVPVPTGGNQADAMLWQFSSGFWFRMPWGYAVQAGPEHRALVSTANNPVIASLDAIGAGHKPPAVQARTLVQDLVDWQVRTVVVGPSSGQARVTAWLARVLQRRPTWYGRVAFWRLR